MADYTVRPQGLVNRNWFLGTPLITGAPPTQKSVLESVFVLAANFTVFVLRSGEGEGAPLRLLVLLEVPESLLNLLDRLLGL
jgi:hypothetical protein